MKFIRVDRLVRALTEQMIDREWEAFQHNSAISRERGGRPGLISKQQFRAQFNFDLLNAVVTTGAVVVSCERLGGRASLEYALDNMRDSVTDEDAWLSLSNAQDLSIELTGRSVTRFLDAEPLPFGADVEAEDRGLANKPQWASDIQGMTNLNIFWIVRHRKMWKSGMTQVDEAWSDSDYYDRRQLFDAVVHAAKAVADRAHFDDDSGPALSKLFGRVSTEIKYGLREAGLGHDTRGSHPHYKFVYKRLKYIEEWALARKSPP